MFRAGHRRDAHLVGPTHAPSVTVRRAVGGADGPADDAVPRRGRPPCIGGGRRSPTRARGDRRRAEDRLEIVLDGGSTRAFELPLATDDTVDVRQGDPPIAVVCSPDADCTRYRLEHRAVADTKWRCGRPWSARPLVAGTADRTCPVRVDQDGAPSIGRPLTRIGVDCR